MLLRPETRAEVEAQKIYPVLKKILEGLTYEELVLITLTTQMANSYKALGVRAGCFCDEQESVRLANVVAKVGMALREAEKCLD